VHAIAASLTAAALLFAPAHHSRTRHHVAKQAPKATATTSRARVQLSALESQLLTQINAYRFRHGLRAYRLNARLTAAANLQSTSMVTRGFFAHESANGGAFWKRIAAFYGFRGYRNWSVGENLLYSSPDVSSSSALRMWITSPEHKANLLDRGWREIGLAAVHVPSAPGVFHGDSVTVVTADFGVRY
jgi:uncharacterized protein YkwD